MKSKLVLGALSLMMVVGACAGCAGGKEAPMASPSATAPVISTEAPASESPAEPASESPAAPASESAKAPATESAKASTEEGSVPETTYNLGDIANPSASASAKTE